MDWLKLFDRGRPLTIAVARPDANDDVDVRRMRSAVQLRSAAELWLVVPETNELGARHPFDYDERVQLELGEDSGVFTFPAIVRRAASTAMSAALWRTSLTASRSAWAIFCSAAAVRRAT